MSDLFESNISLRKIAGCYYPQKNDSIKTKMLYYTWNFINNLFLVIFLILEISVLFFPPTGEPYLKFMIRHLGMLITHAIAFYKLFILFYHSDKIKFISEQLHSKQLKYQNATNFYPEEKLNDARRITARITYFLFCFYSCVGILGHISSILALGRKTVSHDQPCFNFMTYFVFLPINIDTNFRCQFVLALNDIGLDLFAFSIAIHDSLLAITMFYLKAHFVITAEAFRTIRERVINDLKLKQKYFNDEDNTELEKALYGEMRKCTINLSNLLKLSFETEKVFNFSVLLQTISTIQIYASCLYTAASIPILSWEFYSTLQYFTALLVQFGCFCWFGNELTLACSSVSQGIIESEWLSASKRFKVSMLLNLARLQKPAYISIGKFTPLSITTIVSVIRVSFSYFTVFKTI